MSELGPPRPAPALDGAEPAAAAPAPGAPPPAGGHPAPRVFSPVAFVLVLVAVLGAMAVAPLASSFFGDRLALAGPVAAGLAAVVAAAFAMTLAYLLTGTGRLDGKVSYELFVARSHLRLSARTIAGLFVLVVTGLVPGLLVALGWSLFRDARERRAYRRGELFRRGRMPATLLMTLISIGGVAIGVWALTVVLSVMSGFEADLKRKILGHNAHGMVLSYGPDAFQDWRAARRSTSRGEMTFTGQRRSAEA